jgi:hypothetical protein
VSRGRRCFRKQASALFGSAPHRARAVDQAGTMHALTLFQRSRA